MAQGGSAAVAPEGALDTARRARLREAVADLSPVELQWASGYLAGLADAAGHAVAGPDTSAVAAADDQPRLVILYGSQTGNARGIADRLAASARSRGLAVELSSLADYRPAKLAQERLAVVVVSTHGEGDPPDDAIDFHGFLHGRRAPPLGQLRYAVLALGDSSYEHYCKTGRDLDERLAALGASRLAERAECDVDFRADAETWSSRILEAAAKVMVPAEGARTVARLQAVPSRPRYTAEHPFHAELLTNQPLTGRGSGVDVRHIELELGDSGITYAAGDALAVRPANGQQLVMPVVQALGLDPDAPVPGPQGDRPLAEALRDDYEITVLGRRFVEGWAALSGSGELTALLADRPAAAAWMKERQVIDVLRQYPARIDPAALLECLRPLTPRLYSIASGPSANPGEVHLTVGVVHYTAWGHSHAGAASSYLASAVAGERVPVWVEPNERFRLPADDVPIVMIGPGTGVAPFRAFVEEREARGASGRNWLFFGARHFDTDFLYQLEWLRHRKRGLLSRLDVAFSRDQAEKIYVQNRLLEQAATLYAWLEEGAHLYVCGDAASMAPDVHAALGRVVTRASGRSAEDAADYVDGLRRQRRYHRDVY